MIQQVEEFNRSSTEKDRITISVEIEKTREPLYQLFQYGDVVRLLWHCIQDGNSQTDVPAAPSLILYFVTVLSESFGFHS